MSKKKNTSRKTVEVDRESGAAHGRASMNGTGKNNNKKKIDHFAIERQERLLPVNVLN